jgi:hypothetical protein
MPEFAYVKSSRSGAGNGSNCVEVARNVPGVVAVRDSKDPQGPILTCSPERWTSFLRTVGTGTLDS